MRMNNQGFEESNMGFEESMEMTCFYFPPSPTNFPLYRPMPSVFFVSSEQGKTSFVLSYQHMLEDKSGALHVINGLDGVASYMGNKFHDLLEIVRAAGGVPKDVESLVDNIFEQGDYDDSELTLRRINWLEQHDEDIVDQPIYELVGMVHQLIQNRGGELDVIKLRDGTQGSPTAPETLLNYQAKRSFRVWLGHGGQWAAEARFTCSRLNIGSFTTVEDAISAYEVVWRCSGKTDLTGFAGLFENKNRSNLSLQLPPPTQELNPVEVVGTGSEGTRDCIMADQTRLNSRCLGKKKTKEKNPGGRGGRRSKKTNGVRIAIPLEDILQTKGMSLKEAANHLGVSQSSLKYACREYGIPRWPPRKLITQSHPNETPALVDQEGIPQSNSDTLPSDQALAAPVEKITSVVVKEILPLPFLPIARQESLNEDFGNFEAEVVGIGSGGTGQSEMEEGQLNSRYSGKEKSKEMTPRGERRNKENGGVRIEISLEEILQTKKMPLKDAAKHLKVGRSTLEHNLISCPNETPAFVDQEGIPQLNFDTLPSDLALAATVGTNSVVVREIPQPQFSLTDRQDNPDDDFGNYEVEGVGMGVEGTREGEMEEGQLNSGCLRKGKSKEGTPGGDNGSKKTNMVKIPIPLEDILQAGGLHLNAAAKKFEVSRSTLKRVCRGYGILSWPPSNGNEHISQSRPKESLAVVDQEGVQQLNCDILPSNQVLATNVDKNSVVLKARWVDDIIVKIRLPKPWKMAELEQQVKKRLKLESGTYYIRYKDEENELITILCDEDLQEYISSSRPLDTSSIEVFLVPK